MCLESLSIRRGGIYFLKFSHFETITISTTQLQFKLQIRNGEIWSEEGQKKKKTAHNLDVGE